MTEPTTDPISRTRALCKLAAMAAGGLPAPTTIRLNTERKFISLGFDTIADQAPWMTPLGVDPNRSNGDFISTGDDGKCRRIVGGYVSDWHGWSVNVQTSEPATPAETIDADDPDVADVLAAADEAVTR